MNYVEKLELLDLIADYIEYKIDDIQNVKYAYDYVIEMVNDCRNLIELYIPDPEFSRVFQDFFFDLLKYLKKVEDDYLNYFGEDTMKSFASELKRLIKKYLPRDIIMRKIFLEMILHENEIANLLNIKKIILNECLNKMCKNSDGISTIINAEKIIK